MSPFFSGYLYVPWTVSMRSPYMRYFDVQDHIAIYIDGNGNHERYSKLRFPDIRSENRKSWEILRDTPQMVLETQRFSRDN